MHAADREAPSSCRSRRVEQGQHRQRGRRQGSDKEESGAFGTGLTKRKDAGGGRRRSRREEGQVTATSPDGAARGSGWRTAIGGRRASSTLWPDSDAYKTVSGEGKGWLTVGRVAVRVVTLFEIG